MGFDEATGQLVMFGGAGSRAYGDTWTWDGAAWSHISPAHAPSARLGAAMAYDPMSKRLLLYGGASYDPGDERAPAESTAGMPHSTVYSDTWAWDGQDWTQLAASRSGGGVMPQSLMAFDAADRVMIRQEVCNQFCREAGGSVFAWRNQRWEEVDAGHQPTNESGQSDVYPPAVDLERPAFDPFNNVGPARALAAEPHSGGLLYVERNDGYGQRPNVVTTLRLVGGAWHSVPAGPSPSRYPLPYAVMAPDASGGDLLYDGLGDTAVWDGSSWTAYSGVHPAMRAGAAMAYDPRSRSVILYGGVAAKPGGIYADTWSWDGHSWRRAAGPAGTQAIPTAWARNDPDPSASRFSHAQVMAAARRGYGGSVTRVEAKLVRRRDAVRMGVEQPQELPWWDAGDAELAGPQGGRLEWVTVAFCDHSSDPHELCGAVMSFPPSRPVRWTSTTVDAMTPGRVEDASMLTTSGADAEPKGWSAMTDLSAPPWSWWAVAGVAAGIVGVFGILAVAAGFVLRRRRPSQATP